MQVMDKFGEAHESIFSRGETGRLNSLSVVLSQEIDRFNKLTKQMVTSLKELQKAIKGLVVMSDELEQMLHSMLDSKVCMHGYDMSQTIRSEPVYHVEALFDHVIMPHGKVGPQSIN